MSVMC